MTQKVYVVGLGPGGIEQMTQRAKAALESCDVIAGYHVYIDLIKNDFTGKEFLTTGMRKEVDRCKLAIEEALKGKTVAMISSGDAGVYGMAGIMYQVAAEHPELEIEVVPGITAACSGAAVLGAPLIVLPGSYKEASKFLDGPGNKVLMKSASEIARVRDELKERGLIKNAAMVERCGLPGEKVYRDLNEIDPNSSYFSVILVKEKEFDK